MNILSLFNGFGGAFLAFEVAKVKIDKLYVSEVDKHAIKVAYTINPNNINLGDVTQIDVSKLDKIDIVVGGSPCQSFSFAGKRKGMSTKCELKITTLEQYLELKENNFEFEGQSYLFWEYMRILKDIQKYNPDVIFFLENVVMTKDWEHVLSEAIGIKPVMINSAFVSAQNRNRLYWSNIKTRPDGFFGDLVQDIEQPQDKGILLKDVLEDEVDKKYYLSEKMISMLKGKAGTTYDTFGPANLNGKSRTINARLAKMGTGDNYIFDDVIKVDKQLNPKANQQKASCLTAGGHSGGNHSDMDLLLDENLRIRRLTPRECFRLQTVPEHHIETILNSGVSNSQLYKMCGNGFTIDVIAHFFKELHDAEAQQMKMF